MKYSHQQESARQSNRRSVNSGSSRKGRRSSSRKSPDSKSRSPKRTSNDPNRTSKVGTSKEQDKEAKEKARAGRGSGNIATEMIVVGYSGTAEPSVEGGRRKHRSSKRKSQQGDKLAKKDATEKIDALIMNRLDEPITVAVPGAPGAHAASRGNPAAKDEKDGKVTTIDLSRVRSEEEDSRLHYVTTNDLEVTQGQVFTDAAPGTGVVNRLPRRSKRRSQQDRGIAKDAAAKINNLLDRSNQPITSPEPGAHAESRGNEVPKDQNLGKGRHSRPLGTQSVVSEEEHVRMEAEKVQEQGGLNGDGLVMANTVENHDADLAMALLNSMLDHIDEGNDTHGDKDTTGRDKSSDSREEENKEGENGRGSDEKDWEQSKLKKGARIFRYLCCIAVLAGAGIATWIALQANSESESKDSASGGVPSNVTTDMGTVAPSSPKDPSSTVNPNPNPNAPSASTGPSSDINIGDIIFEPPSPKDCAIIINGGAIPGQDSMPMQSYLLDLDATPFLPMDLSILAGIIEDKLRELLAPALTGCDRDLRNLRSTNRHLAAPDDGFSYAIGNVMVDAFGVEGVSCLDESNPQCHRIGSTLDIVVKDNGVKVATIITELVFFFGGGGLAEKLELAELYESIKVVNLGSIDQTGSPSISAPSAVSSPALVETSLPSESPTEGPTPKPTPPPTFAPVVGPTPKPTPEPTPEPTPQPILQPTLQPSPQPTLQPTPELTLPVTLRPTPFPTFAPVASVAPPPTPSPTPRPTPFPTLFPTLQPSATPSQSPSKSPSEAPSSSPSFVPPTAPSSKPSLSPSSGPSKQPSTAPSSSPTVSASAELCWVLINTFDFYTYNPELSEDGSTILLYNNEEKELRVYDTVTGNQIGNSISNINAYCSTTSYSIKADGTMIVDGCTGSWGSTGIVRVFKYYRDSWSQITTLVGEEEAQAGLDVQISNDGTRLLVRCRKDGAVLYYSLDPITGATSLLGTIDAPSNGAQMSGDGLRIAAIHNNPSGFAVGMGIRVYEWNGNSFSQIGSRLGYGPFAFSSDGNSVGFGINNQIFYSWNGSSWISRLFPNREINAVSGNVILTSVGELSQVFKWNGNSWVQIGDNIEESTWFGTMSSDKSTIASATHVYRLDACSSSR
ncbi:unnamed protein product [Cylindrotheca closterium]|uniref:Uncharacterized protein n=1 Tax=Cylindrotheca closterium TaxID=2856 RepID=A0AAD2G6S6_9STRA|nr:unnamed protein product [Cylindrotheca closterium]